MRVTNILLLEQHLMPDHAHSAHPPPHKHTHTHQQKGNCLPYNLCPSHLQHTHFPTPITTNAQVFLSHNCPKRRENLFHKSWNFTLIEFNFTYIQQVQDINTNSGHNMNDLAPRALLFFKSDICELLRSCKISKDIFLALRWVVYINPLTPKISLLILLTVCHIVLVMLVWRY